MDSHPESTASPAPPTPSYQPRSTNNGYGVRHAFDSAPFSLWDESAHDFRLPTLKETKWILDAFSVTSVTSSWPDMFIETRHLPNPIPLTVACVAATFIPPGSKAPYLPVSIAYSNPRLPDPLSPHIKLPKWERPSQEQREAVWQALSRLMTVQAVNYVPPTIIVEIAVDDGRSYSTGSLPRTVGGISTVYHHRDTPFWSFTCRGRERFEVPVAIGKPYSSTTFTDGVNFQAPPPKRLLHSTEIQNHTWCRVDGMAGRRLLLRVAGIKDRSPPRHPGTVVPFNELITETIYRLHRPTSGPVHEEFCGAPIVVDDNKDAGIVGFFQLGVEGSDWASSPCLDDFIDREWTVA